MAEKKQRYTFKASFFNDEVTMFQVTDTETGEVRELGREDYTVEIEGGRRNVWTNKKPEEYFK